MYPAVKMALKQDFWSILDQTTYFACGLLRRRESKHKTMAIPVETGATKASLTPCAPLNRSQSTTMELVRASKIDDPAAFGWGSLRSPDRPIP